MTARLTTDERAIGDSHQTLLGIGTGEVIATELVENTHYTVVVLRPDQIDLIAAAVVARLTDNP